MNRSISFLAVAALAGGLATAAVAQTEPTAGPKTERLTVMFEKLDKNGDGVVEKAEYDVVRVRAFDRLDTNKDGRITAEEIEAVAAKRNWPAERREKMLKRIGVTTPQGVTKDEYLARKSVFERVDVDADGKVTMTEVDTFVTKVKERQARRAAKAGTAAEPAAKAAPNAPADTDMDAAD